MFNVALDPHSTFTVRSVSQIELQSLYRLLASQIRFTDVVFKYLLDISIRFSAWETSAINHSINCYICNMQNNLQLRWLCRNSNSISMFWTPRQLCCVPYQLKYPVFIICHLFSLYWLPIAARIKFKVLMFAYKTTTGTAPIYLNLLVQTYAPSRSLRSASERRLVVPSQRGTKSLSQTFSWTVPSWWNDLPISIRTAESLAIFKKHLKTHLFRQHLTN